jgi:hypothetical protein
VGGQNGARFPDNKSLRKFVVPATNLLAVVGTAMDVPVAYIKVFEIGPAIISRNPHRETRKVLTGFTGHGFFYCSVC